MGQGKEVQKVMPVAPLEVLALIAESVRKHVYDNDILNAFTPADKVAEAIVEKFVVPISTFVSSPNERYVSIDAHRLATRINKEAPYVVGETLHKTIVQALEEVAKRDRRVHVFVDPYYGDDIKLTLSIFAEEEG